MLTAIHPKLPMRDKKATRNFYSNKLGFQEFGSADFDGYLMMQKTGFKFIFLKLQDAGSKRKLWTSLHQNK